MSQLDPVIVFEQEIARLQKGNAAKWLSRKVIHTLYKIEGYEDVPKEVQKCIAEACATLYAAGFFHGRKNKPGGE